MRTSKLQNLFGIVIATLCLSAFSHQSQAATNKANHKSAQQAEKERLVLMPLRVPDEDKNLTGAMETALLEGLQQKYVVFSGEQVSQKAHEIFMKETRNTAHKECDETKCMQNIAMAFQAELIATANVTKQDGGYFLALKIENIFDNKAVYSKSVACANCTSFQVVDKLKELSGTVAPIAAVAPAPEEPQQAASQKGYQGYLIKQGGLTWIQLNSKDYAPALMWTDANAYCANTAINGQNGWRLPTKDELIALYNSGAMKGQGWTLIFTWSSTPVNAGTHYDVNLSNGYVHPGVDTNTIYVTCVR
jgi:hypothetical protein